MGSLVKYLVRQQGKHVLGQAALRREMKAEGAGKPVSTRAAPALIEGKNRDEIVGESIVLPEIPLRANDFDDSRANLRIRNAESAPCGNDQHTFAQLRLLNVEVPGKEYRLLNLAPGTLKPQALYSAPKAGGDRPAAW